MVMRTRLDEIRVSRCVAVRFVLFVSVCCHANASWVDPDTPQKHQTTRPLAEGDKREFRLVCVMFLLVMCQKMRLSGVDPHSPIKCEKRVCTR